MVTRFQAQQVSLILKFILMGLYLTTYLTDEIKIESVYSSNNKIIKEKLFDFKIEEIEYLNRCLVDDKIEFTLSDVMDDILIGNYRYENSTHNYIYGSLYVMLCNFYGQMVEENEFYHDNDLNFLYDKLTSFNTPKSFFKLPEKMDFPCIYSISVHLLDDLKEQVNAVMEYKTEYINLSQEELKKLKEQYLKLIEKAKSENMAIIFSVS